MEMEGLENRLDVHVGDLIMLTGLGVVSQEVAGYVVDFGPKYVDLSTRNPFSQYEKYRRYWLKRFKFYELIKKYDKSGLSFMDENKTNDK